MPNRLLLLLLILLNLSSYSFATAPANEPILRIDAGAHSDAIERISVDATGKTFLTCSDDKTARLYDVETGSLLKVFRSPVGPGSEGKLYACALSPDGTLAAVGGYTSLDSEKGATIYLFDTGTGALTRRIKNINQVVLDLAFSPDGRNLVASLGGNKGIRLFLTADGRELARDSDYGKSSQSIHYSLDAHIVSTSYDGYLRLYDHSLTLLNKILPTAGQQLHSARFSPDGSRIAVGYKKRTQVDVFSTANLKYLFSPDTSKLKKGGGLSVVAWSADSHTIYAGGGYSDKYVDGLDFIMVSWDKGGRGSSKENYLWMRNTLLASAPLPDGSLLYAGGSAVLGRLFSDGRVDLVHKGSIADYRDFYKEFELSPDGTKVAFSYESGGIGKAWFDIQQRQFQTDFSTIGRLYEPRTISAELNVTNWKDNRSPKLKGLQLKLEKGERSISLAIGPKEKRFILGTNRYLRCYDTTGALLWKKQALGEPWLLNVAPNGKVVVVALSDGTIRWYRMSDSAELLAFFPHADQKRWVLWTPSGYYDASPGGEELIGWHLNNGKDQEVDFFPASRFRESRYRPDIVTKVLETFDEKEAITAANAASNRRESVDLTQQLPPVVTILNYQNGSTVTNENLELNIAVRSPSGAKVTGVRVLVDGRPVTRERGISLKTKQNSGTRNIRVTIPPRNCEVSVLAETANTASVPATVRLVWKGTQPKQDEFIAKPKLYVLAIGVSDYKDPTLKLDLAAKDAQDFAATLKKQKGGLYRDVVTKVLIDDAATKDDVLDGLDWLVRETTSRDVAMLFIAGHGINDPYGTYYYLPQNANLDKLRRTGVVFADIKNTLAALAGKALFFVDTCHSGNVMGGRRAAPTDINGLVNELSSAENGAVVFASSTGRQYSLENLAWGNGAFTKALVEGLSGQADYTGKGKISINMLDLYLSERVKELTNGLQTPTTTKPQTIADFPIAVKL
jgi:WD40 repeat protein